jgi:WD repeat-containing protein 19
MVDNENRIKYFYIDEMTMIAEYKVDTNIARIWPNVTGTRMVTMDMQGNGYLYSPINDAFLKLTSFPGGVNRVIWDNFDHNFFIGCDSTNAYGFIYTPVSLNGPVVESVRELLSIEDLEEPERPSITILDKEIRPLVLTNGNLCCFSEAQGMARGNFLSSHSYLDMWRGRNDTTDGHYKYFLQNLAIKRFKECYVVAEKLGHDAISDALGGIALKNLELEIAEKAY